MTATCPNCGFDLGADGAVLDVAASRVQVPGRAAVKLSPRECEALAILAAQAGNLLPRWHLTDRLFGTSDLDAADSSLRALLHKLRQRLAGSPLAIDIVRGQGVVLRGRITVRDGGGA